MALTDKLTAIGDAIRAKNGTTAKLSLTDMPTAISNIKTTSNLTTLDVTANGTYTATSANYDGYSTVTVNVQPSSSATDDKSHTWRDGTWSDISTALDNIYNHNADPSTYFTVGDIRDSIDGNSKKFIITGLNHDTLATPINGHTTAALTFMTTNDYYKSSYHASGDGDYVTSGMQNYINGYTGRLPEYSGDIVPLLKNVVKQYSTCDSKTSPPTIEKTVTCKLFLPSLAEVFSQSALQGKRDYNNFFMLDPNAGSQYDLFKGSGKIWYIAIDETTLCQKSLYRDTYVTSSGTYYPIMESDYFHGFRFSATSTVCALRVMGCL